MTDDEILKQKEISYYSALLNAWINTKMERDRTILTISSGAIGVLITLLTTVGAKNCLEIILFMFAFVLFITTVILVLNIFSENSRYIEEIIVSGKKEDFRLSYLDKISTWTFIGGLVISVFIGVLLANEKLNEQTRGNAMADEKKIHNTDNVSNRPLGDSLNKLGILNPKAKEMGKSLNNLGKLQPTSGNGGSNPTDNTGKNENTNGK